MKLFLKKILSHGMAFRSLFLIKNGAKVCNPFFRAKYITRIFNNTKNTPPFKKRYLEARKWREEERKRQRVKETKRGKDEESILAWRAIL